MCNAPTRRRGAISPKTFTKKRPAGSSPAGPTPGLFLEYPRGLGMSLARFEAIELLPAARRFREALDEYTRRRG